MRWRKGRKSSNIEDRRGMGVPMKAVGGGIGGLVVLVIALLLGTDLGQVSNVNPGSNFDPASLSAEDRELADFVSVVLADTEDTWAALFAADNREYREPTLVLFTNAV